MGAAAHRSGGEVGLVLSATAAAAALYGAVVLIGVGPSSPLALNRTSARPQLAVHLRVHDPAAPRPAVREPQPSPGRAQRRALVVRAARPVHTVRQRTRRTAIVSTLAETKAPSSTLRPASVAPVPVLVLPEVPVSVAVVVPVLPVLTP